MEARDDRMMSWPQENVALGILYSVVKQENQNQILARLRFQNKFLTKRRRKIIESIQLKDDDASRSQNSAQEKPEEGEEDDEESFTPQHVWIQSLIFTALAVHGIHRHT
jgi:hypothetical protein